MNQPTIEVVSFKLAPGVADADFLAANQAFIPVLKGCSGFVRRRLSRSEDGTWLDHVEWQSLAEAKRGGDTVMATDQARSFVALIDAASIQMRHEALHLSID